MNWIYLENSMDSICLAESGVYPSLLCLGFKQLHTVKLKGFVKRYYLAECHKVFYAKRRYGTTFQHCTSKRISTLFSEAFHVKISVALELEKAWKESEADCFSRSCAWPKKSSPHSYSLKTFQLLQQEGDFESLKKLPRWGMIVDGVLYPQHLSEHYIKENVGSYWPTPTTQESVHNILEIKNGRRVSKNGSTHSIGLADRVIMDTGLSSQKKPCFLKMATPTASQASKPILAPCPSCVQGKHGETLQQSMGRLYPKIIGKRLCSRWTSLLMGYPTKWTDLEPWAIAWFHNK